MRQKRGIDCCDLFRDKLKMLANNLNMMTFELTKICKTYKIVDFKKEKMSTYPEEAQGRLQTAVTCVEKAEQTLSEFKEFLKTDKYKEWNEEQVICYKQYIQGYRDPFKLYF
jgi:hypothetical protein